VTVTVTVIVAAVQINNEYGVSNVSRQWPLF